MYYVRIRGKVFGPLEENQVIDMIRQGKFGRMNEISTDNCQWVRADECEQFFPKSRPKRKPLLNNALELPKDNTSVQTWQPDSETISWYYSDDGKTGVGPFPQSNIEQMVRLGKITAQTILWHDHLDPQTAENVAEFARYFRKSSRSGTRQNRNSSQFHQASENTPRQYGILAPEILEQLEKAGTWSFVLVLVLTIGMAVLLISQLFLFVFIAQTDSVPLTLAYLLIMLVSDLVCVCVIFTF